MKFVLKICQKNNLKTNESVQHVLGDFELAAAQRTEKVGDDIIVELYIFNVEHCFYKQNIEKVWNEGFQDQWIVEINKLADNNG